MVYKFITYLNKKKNFPYYFITPLFYSLGDAAEQILITASEIKNKKIFIIGVNIFNKFLKYKLCNKELFNNITIKNFNNKDRFYIYTLVKFFVSIEFFFRRTIILYLNFFFKKNEFERFPYLGINIHYNLENNFNKIKEFKIHNSNINLEKNINYTCKKLYQSYLKSEKKYICLHVRDQNFHRDNKRRVYRNSNINNYIELIKLLIKNEYIVIRLGNYPCNNIKFKDKQYFDYPSSEIKSSIMDLYLIKNCHFFIGNQSGPVEVANMFLKPILLTNMTDIFQILPRKKIDRGLFKKVFDNKKNLFITLHEYISSNFLNFTPENEIVDFKFQENSAVELYDAGLEYLKLINNNNFILSKKQIRFNQYLKNRFKEFYQQQKLNKVLKKNYLESDKYIKWMRSYHGAFLNTNFKK